MLTDTKLRSLANNPPAERVELNDGTISGLLLRVGPRGRPTWTLRYTVTGRGGVSERGKQMAGRKFYRITLGEYPALSLIAARAKAATMLADADRGIDPVERLERAATVRRGTMAELAEAFLEDHCRGRLQSAGKAEWIMRDYVVPRFGDYAPKNVTRQDIVALLDDLKKRATKTATMDTRKWLSIMYSWAVEKGRVDFNPVAGIRPTVKSTPRERVLSLEEARAVWKAAQAEPYPSGSLVCLLMLTGARLREIGNSQVGWLDRANACFDIPAAAYKTRESTVIPLIPEAMRIVERIPKPPRGDFLISSNGGKRPVWTVTPEALARIRQGAEAEVGRKIEHWTIHDLRRTAATHMARLGVDEIVVERVLGHRIGGVKGVYNRYRYIEEKRAALALWAAELLATPSATNEESRKPRKVRADARPKPMRASVESASSPVPASPQPEPSSDASWESFVGWSAG
jgi:integrase